MILSTPIKLLTLFADFGVSTSPVIHNVTIHQQNQHVLIDNFLQMVELDKTSVSLVSTPYHRAYPVEKYLHFQPMRFLLL